MTTLEVQLNEALQSRLPAAIPNHRHRLAIDLNLIPYYGKPTPEEAPYIYRSRAKAGTTSFFAYATVYVIRAHQRVSLAIHAIPRGETLGCYDHLSTGSTQPVAGEGETALP